MLKPFNATIFVLLFLCVSVCLGNDKDYYAVLGVKKNDIPEVIRLAYRRLTRTFHPDVNPSPEATAQFQEIQEAYSVLGDPDRRNKYDLYGSDFENVTPFEEAMRTASRNQRSYGPTPEQLMMAEKITKYVLPLVRERDKKNEVLHSDLYRLQDEAKEGGVNLQNVDQFIETHRAVVDKFCELGAPFEFAFVNARTYAQRILATNIKKPDLSLANAAQAKLKGKFSKNEVQLMSMELTTFALQEKMSPHDFDVLLDVAAKNFKKALRHVRGDSPDAAAHLLAAVFRSDRNGNLDSAFARYVKIYEFMNDKFINWQNAYMIELTMHYAETLNSMPEVNAFLEKYAEGIDIAIKAEHRDRMKFAEEYVGFKPWENPDAILRCLTSRLR